MKKILYVSLAACTLFVASCTNEELADSANMQQGEVAFEAVTETGSRTLIDGKQVKWTAGDAIYVYDNTGKVTGTLELTAGEGETDGTFSGKVYGGLPSSLAHAVYPAPANASGAVKNITLGSYDYPNTNAPMYAEVSGNTLTFKHLCGYMRITIANFPEGAQTLEITGNGIAGQAAFSNGTLTSPTGSQTLKINFDADDVTAGVVTFDVPLYPVENAEIAIKFEGDNEAFTTTQTISKKKMIQFPTALQYNAEESKLEISDVPEQGKTLAEMVAVEGAVVSLTEPGTYTFPTTFAEGVTLVCAEGVVFEGQSNPDIKGATIVGGTFKNTQTNGIALQGTVNGTFKNCTFTGEFSGLRWCYAGETTVFEDCVFEGGGYGAHFDGGANDIVFKNCTFSGFNAFGKAVTSLTLDGCTFKVYEGQPYYGSHYNGANFWGATTLKDCKFMFDGAASSEWIDFIWQGEGNSMTNCTLGDGSTILTQKYLNARENVDVTIDGVLYEDLGDYTFLADKEDMVWFSNEVNVNKKTFAGKTVMLSSDIDLNNEAWTPIGQTGATEFKGVFDGQEYTIYNLNIDSENETGADYSSALFGWIESHGSENITIKNVKVNGAKVNGHHNVAVIAGYLTGSATVENCHVTGAEITCTKANDKADGDKAGVIVGNGTSECNAIKGCSAKNSTVSAGRDAGQIVGACSSSLVTDCSVEGVIVSSNGTSTGENINNALIGRTL